MSLGQRALSRAFFFLLNKDFVLKLVNVFTFILFLGSPFSISRNPHSVYSITYPDLFIFRFLLNKNFIKLYSAHLDYFTILFKK